VTLSDRDYQAGLSAAQAVSPAASITDPEDYYNARFLVSWILFNGFERHHTHAAARFGQQFSEASRQDAKRLLLSAVSSAYYAAQLAAESIQIAEADEGFNLRQLTEAKARRRVGTGSLSDVLNFEVRANEAKAQVIQAKSVYDRTVLGLAALLGDLDILGPLENLKLAPLSSETEDEMEMPVATRLISYARQHRPDIRQAVLEERQAEASIGIARARFYPALTLSASIDGDATGEAEIGADDLGNTIAVSLSYPLFSGGLNRSMLREAKAKLEEAEKRYAGLETDMRAQVRRAVAGVTSAQEQLGIQRRNAALVKRNRDLVEKEYVAGQGSLVRLNQAQRDLTNAQGRLALALVSLRQAWYDLQTETAQILSRYD